MTSTHSGGRGKHHARTSFHDLRYECHKCDRKTFKRSKASGEPKYCEAHQCGVIDVHGLLCSRRKERKDTFCGRHLCKTSDCKAQRILNEDGSADHCVEHTCVLPGCMGGRDQSRSANANPQLCNRHSQEFCGTIECHKRRIETGCYCANHNCRIPGCPLARVNGSRPFCSGHNICGNEECKKEKVKLGDRFQSVCQDHLQCASDLCRRKSALGSPFCDFHSCKYQNCLKSARLDIGKPFCRNHECEAANCRSPKTHIEADPEGDSELELHKFCYQHKCAEHECMVESDPTKGYCERHWCIEKDCKKRAEIQHRCFTHYEKKVAADTEKRISAEFEAKQAQAKAEEKRRQQEREKENTTPPHSSGTSNIGEEQRRHGRRGNSPRWREYDDYEPRYDAYGTYERDKFWHDGRSGH